MTIALSHLGHWLPCESGVIHPGLRSSGMVALVRAHRAQHITPVKCTGLCKVGLLVKASHVQQMHTPGSCASELTWSRAWHRPGCGKAAGGPLAVSNRASRVRKVTHVRRANRRMAWRVGDGIRHFEPFTGRSQQCPSSRFVGRQRRSASDCNRALACGCGQHLVSISNLILGLQLREGSARKSARLRSSWRKLPKCCALQALHLLSLVVCLQNAAARGPSTPRLCWGWWHAWPTVHCR